MNDINNFALMMVLFMGALLFWETFLLYPLRLLVTLFHEASHAITAKLTGGKVQWIGISPNIKGTQAQGVTVIEGGNHLLVLNSGYLGSLGIGILLFWLSYTQAGGFSLLVMVILAETITVLWVRNTFGLVFNTILCIVLGSAGFLIGDVQLLVTRFIGICSVMFSIIDIQRGENTSDAHHLSELTKIPSFVWSKAWQVVSLLGILLVAKIAGVW